MATEDKPAGAASDETKRRFREALDKKNAASRDGEAHMDGESIVNEAQPRAGHKREFRRKSG